MKKAQLIFMVLSMVIIPSIIGCNNKKNKENLNEEIPNDEKLNMFLWNDVKSGMSMDEVKKLYPTSELIETEDEDDENIDILQFDGVVIQNNAFLVHFIFDNKELNAVSLSTKEKLRAAVCEELLTGLKEEMILKYGNSVDENLNRLDFLYDLEEYFWNDNDLTISLHYIKPRAVSFDPGFIEVYYEKR